MCDHRGHHSITGNPLMPVQINRNMGVFIQDFYLNTLIPIKSDRYTSAFILKNIIRKHSNVITHHIPKYFPINHRSSEIAVITHMFKNTIWKIRMISIVYCVNLVEAQGWNPKCYISNSSPALLPSDIPQLVSNYI